jgi:hypothetical protein
VQSDSARVHSWLAFPPFVLRKGKVGRVLVARMHAKLHFDKLLHFRNFLEMGEGKLPRRQSRFVSLKRAVGRFRSTNGGKRAVGRLLVARMHAKPHFDKLLHSTDFLELGVGKLPRRQSTFVSLKPAVGRFRSTNGGKRARRFCTQMVENVQSAGFW